MHYAHPHVDGSVEAIHRVKQETQLVKGRESILCGDGNVECPDCTNLITSTRRWPRSMRAIADCGLPIRNDPARYRRLNSLLGVVEGTIQNYEHEHN